jgi:alkylated DNA repair dioxygenase AlkB
MIILENPISDAHYQTLNIHKFILKYENPMNRFKESKISYISDKDDEDESEPDEEERYPTIIPKKTKNFLPVAVEEKVKVKVKVIKPYDRIPRVIQLNESGTAYIMIDYLPDDLVAYSTKYFNDMYSMHPEEKHKIIMYEKEVEVYRYQKTYLKTPKIDETHLKTHSYMYSGYESVNSDILPPIFVPYHEYMKQADPRYNQMIANWYQDGNDFIAQHSDCTREMIDNGKIAIISLYRDASCDNARVFNIEPRDGYEGLFDKVSIHMYHGTIITMCGTTQKEFTHGISSEFSHKCERLSLSFRQMM